MSNLSSRRWTRRSMLALGAGSTALLLGSTPARGLTVTVDGLSFAVPETIRPVPADSSLGQGWQWLGRLDQPSAGRRAAIVVLARADIGSIDPQEVLGLLLASSAAGFMPGLRLGARRVRSMPGGGDQTRIDVRYLAGRSLPFHGTMLIATRPEPPAAALVMVGDDELTAGTIDGVLDSARWLS
ncbi:MAG TPA: hypothetical protein VGW74_15570 [Propionibacteriaceae bacterium]|nr:hypothetical protein [Propionibacteriaceae bacterium]